MFSFLSVFSLFALRKVYSFFLSSSFPIFSFFFFWFHNLFSPSFHVLAVEVLIASGGLSLSRETKSTRDQQEGKSNLPRLNGLRGKRPGLFVVRNAAFCLKHHGTREDVCRASIRFSPSYDAALLVDSFINTSILRYNNILSCVVYGKMNE